MIVEESRLQALSTLHSTTKDIFLQTNSHRLWCLALLVGSVILLSVFFFQSSGLVSLMIGLAAALVSFTLLLSELYLSRRLSMTRSVLVNIERELSRHISEFLGQTSRLNNNSRHRGSNRDKVSRGNENSGDLLPMSAVSLGSRSSSLMSADSKNWIIFIHGLAAFGVLIPLGVEIFRTAQVDLFSSILALAYLVGVLAFSGLFVYVVSSERKLESIVVGKPEAQATDESRKMVWRTLGLVLVVAGPFFSYAGLNSKTSSMIGEVWDAAMSIGTEATFWAPVMLAAGLFMVFISLIWRGVKSEAEPIVEREMQEEERAERSPPQLRAEEETTETESPQSRSPPAEVGAESK